MTRYSPAMAAGQWSLQNAAFHLLARLGCPTMRLKYEDFITRPNEALRRVAGFAGLTELASDSVHRHGRHVVLGSPRAPHSQRPGNPMRFDTGKISISRDDRLADQHAEGAAARGHRPYLPHAGGLRVHGGEVMRAWPSVGVVIPSH